MRRLRLIAWLLVIVALGAVAWPLAERVVFDRDPQIQFVKIGGAFSLTDQDGRPVTDKDFAGRAMAMFFGFTYCPDVCPTTLSRLSVLMEKLGSDADKLQVVLVSVDPERDTPPVLKEYLQAFDPRFVGLTGTPEQLAAMAKNYRIFFEKVPDASGGYTMNHTAGIYLFDAAGQFTSTIDREESDDVAIAKLKKLLR